MCARAEMHVCVCMCVCVCVCVGKAFVPKKRSDPILENVTLEPELEEALANASDAELCDIAGTTSTTTSTRYTTARLHILLQVPQTHVFYSTSSMLKLNIFVSKYNTIEQKGLSPTVCTKCFLMEYFHHLQNICVA